MAHDWFTLDELSQHLGRDLRELEKLVNRGRIPGHKRGGEWTFQATEVTQWLEQEMRTYSDPELAVVESSQRSPELNPLLPVTRLRADSVPKSAMTAPTAMSTRTGRLPIG